MQKQNRISLLFPLAAAFALASPAAFAQSHGAGAHVSASARVPVQMPAQASAGMQAAQRAEPQKAPPAVPATPATPATPAQPAKDSWSSLDTDGNGSLSMSEAASQESLAKVFGQADADGNGELTAAEYKAWWTASNQGKADSRR